MKALRMLLAVTYLVTATGCAQIREVPKTDALRAGDLKNTTVRTRTGEVYYFEWARVAADSLSGFAQERRTVFLAGGDVREVTEDRQVFLPLADVEQLTVEKRDWKRAGLWALLISGAAGAIALAVKKNSGSGATNGGGYGPKPNPGWE